MILLINTCGAEALVAVAEGDRVIREERFAGRAASEQLVPVLRRMLPGALEAVGVVHGPGSFTGVRVGLGAAKGLCEARGCGLVAMSRLRLLAQGEHALAVLDAGRGEFFCGLYTGGALERESILRLDELLALAGGRAVLTCEPKVREELRQYLDLALVAEPGSAEMLALLRARIGRGEWTDVANADANYLRRTDAELLRERR